MSASIVARAGPGGLLNLLVDRIADGDRAAFRRLYAFLAVPVWRDAARVLPGPADARAATRSTFVEVWHMARHQVDQPRGDTRAWISAIAARQFAERLRACDPPGPAAGEYDRHVHCELRVLLGSGHATIRTGPRTFARVDDINLDLVRRPGGPPAPP